MADVGVDMETDGDDVIDAEASRTIPFQLQFDKPIPFQIKIAEWNPEKDLLALVTDDSKVLLHRFNWQRLWIISPGKCVTSLCWRPDGKTIALGLDDGSIQLHDVENGKLLRSIKSHGAAVVFLNWEEHAYDMMVDVENDLIYEDRTKRFFPPAPRIPRMPGVSSGDNGFLDDPEDCFQELSTAPHQQFNMLCSGDKLGSICFSIFGIFPIAKINISGLSFSSVGKCTRYRLLNASVCKLALSKNLCQLVVLGFGKLVEDFSEFKSKPLYKDVLHAQLDESSTSNNSSGGLHCLLLNTSMFLSRKKELHQVAQQASSIEDLTEVIRASLSVMSKHWSGAMHSFHEKFSSLSSLISGHGLISSPQDEFLSLLFGARTSPPLHQFLVNSLGEAGLKRVSKAVDSAGKEMHTVIHEHLQPAIEIMGFRLAELRGLSRWRARYQLIGLDEKLTEAAVEKAGMMLVQVERLRRVLTVVLYQFQNFFNWVLRCIKMLLSEPTDQLQAANSELVVIFLKFLFDHDPVGQLLEASHKVAVDEDTVKRLEQLVIFGGFSDTKYLERTLASEFAQLENCLKEAFLMPFTTISEKIQCKDILPLYSIPSSPSFSLSDAPISVSYYLDNYKISSQDCIETRRLIDYICFRIPDESWNLKNCFAIIRGFTNCSSSIEKSGTSPEAILLYLSDQYQLVDLSLYKENQLVLLLNEATYTSESPGKSLMLMLPITDLAFSPLSRELPANFWKLYSLRASSLEIEDIHVKGGKVRYIADSVTSPLAVSASRGLACVLSSRRHALVYILDEDEDEASEAE